MTTNAHKLAPLFSHSKRLFLASPLHFSTVCFVFPTVARAIPLFVFSAFVYSVAAAAAAAAATAAAVAAAAAAADAAAADAAAAAAQHVSRLCAFSSLHRVPLRFASKLGSTRSSECDIHTNTRTSFFNNSSGNI